MAHEITIREDGKAEIAFVGETPWHGLGQELPREANLTEWRKAAGLDWQILSAPVQYQPMTPEASLKTAEGQRVLFRSDNHKALSVVSDKYHEVQPDEVLHFFKDLVESQGYRLHTAGSLKGGRRIWALAETGKIADVVKNDPIGGFLLLATSCDRGLATTARFTSVRVVCANTLAIAERSKENAISVAHNTKFIPENVKKQLGIQVSTFDQFMQNARDLARKQITQDKADQFLYNLWAPYSDNLRQGDVVDVRKMRAYRQVLDLFNGKGKGSDMLGVSGTYWGMVNAVTEFVDHHSFSRSSETRLNTAWFGRGDDIKTNALNLALAA